MSNALYIGIDMGTTAIKVGVVDSTGHVLAMATREFHVNNPSPGYMEFDAEAYLDMIPDAFREVFEKSGADRGHVRAIGLSSQAQTFVLIGDDDRPLRPAISWLDVRAEHEAVEFNTFCTQHGYAPANAIASGPKLLWLRRHEPQVLARARKLLLLPDYLVFRLTRRCVSDVRTAESTGCYDIGRAAWIAPLLELCGLSEDKVCSVRWPGERIGTLCPEMAARLGLPETTLVAVGAMDQLAGAVGVGNIAPGQASVALGTALTVIVTSEKPAPPDSGIAVRPHPIRGLFALLAYAKTAGILLRWYRDNITPALSYRELDKLIAGVPVGSEGLVCIPHFSGTATPTFDSSVRGAFAGLSLTHTPAHMARSILEALSFTVRENLQRLEGVVGRIPRLTVTGGGARSELWLQMIADVTGLPVEQPVVQEAPCFGAALLAMVADGHFASIAETGRLNSIGRTFLPDGTLYPAYEAAYQRYESYYRKICPVPAMKNKTGN